MPASDPVAEPHATRRLPRRGAPWSGLTPGTTLKHYEILRPLGRGGMGDVYLARDTRLGREIALKFLLEATSPERLMVEARTTAGLKHDNIVTLHDIDEYRGVPYLVLEHIAGRTFAELLDARPPAGGGSDAPGLPQERVVELILPVVRGLACAHDARIVHRDLKPSNVMLANNGSVKILDFGVAKMLDDAVDLEPPNGESRGAATPHASWTVTGRRATGSARYMSPEQWGVAPVDPRTDLWAVGILLYEMLTGRHPLDGVAPDRIAKEVMDLATPMPSVLTRLPNLGALGAVIDRCLAKRREDRFASARELSRALESLGPHRRRVSMRTRVLTGAGAVALVSALGVSWVARAHRPAAIAVITPSVGAATPPPVAVPTETPAAAPATTGTNLVSASLPNPKAVRLGSAGLGPKVPAHAAAKGARPTAAASTPKPTGASVDGLFDRE